MKRPPGIQRWSELEPLLEQAFDLPESQVGDFVERVEDPELRLQLRDLVRADQASGVLDGALEPPSPPLATELPIGEGALSGALGDYKLVRRLGAGGMGIVYEAQDRRLGRQVALKVLAGAVQEPASAARFQREARSLAQLNHPHIVTLHALEFFEDQPALVMELVVGEALSSAIPADGFPVDRALELAVALTDAVAFAHEHGIVHRDLKPGNVMLNERGDLKVLDFGLARLETNIATKATTEFKTAAGAVVGTIAYMSPEQAEGREIDHRSDQFSLGCVLYEIFTGVRAFQGDTSNEILAALLSQSPTPPDSLNPTIPRPVVELMERCLAKQPQGRFPETRQLANAVARVKAQRQLGSAQPGDGNAARASGSNDGLDRPQSAKTTVGWFAGALLLIAALVGALWWSGLRQTDNSERSAASESQAPAARQPRTLILTPLALEAVDDDSEPWTGGFLDGLKDELSVYRDLQIQEVGEPLEGASLGKQAAGSYVLNSTIRAVNSASESDFVASVVLHSVGDAEPTWQDALQARQEDVQGLLQQIAARLARQLELTRAAPVHEEAAETAEPNAYFAYLRGLALAAEASDEERFMRAAEAFEQATVLDPEFAAAWGKLSINRGAAMSQGLVKEMAREEAVAWVQEPLDKARSLAPQAPLTRLAGGYYEYYVHRNFEAAHVLFEEVLQQRPYDVDAHRAMGAIQRRRGKFAESITHWETVTRLDPSDVGLLRGVAALHTAVRNHEASARVLDEAIRLTPTDLSLFAERAWNEMCRSGSLTEAQKFLSQLPNPHLAYEMGRLARDYDWFRSGLDFFEPDSDGPDLGVWNVLAGFAERQLGNEEAAKAHFEEAERISVWLFSTSSRHVDRALPIRGLALAYLGRTKEALRIALDFPDLEPGDTWVGPRSREIRAEILTAAGDLEQAVRELEALLEVPYQAAICKWQLRLDPVWDPLRGHPRFEALVAQ